MSATITLEEALKRATRGPVIPLDGELQTDRDVFHMPHSGIIGKTTGERPTLEMQIDCAPFIAAVLAHFYNIGPDLVSRLEALQKWAEQMGGFSSPQWADLPELIERSNKVQLP